jgi:Fic family protein
MRMYSYNKLEKLLAAKNLTKSDLVTMLGISSRTIAKMAKGEKIASHVMNRIATFLGCKIEDLIQYKSDNVLLQTLRDEKDAKISGGVYHELQILMTYNSNHIEGSKLSEKQTRLIFETSTINIDKDEYIPVDDIIETYNHFRAIDYCIDHAEDILTEDIIKKLHLILKQNTKDSYLEWFAVGDYKKLPNVVGGRETTHPKNVASEMQKLLTEYNSLQEIAINDIISFHADFEYIHPFQDGNGRVGRLIAFKECLRFNIVPFIIEDVKKSYYYRGFSNWKKDRNYLIDTCLDGQDTFNDLLVKFGLSN